MRRFVAPAIALAACGRVGFDVHGDAVDAPPCPSAVVVADEFTGPTVGPYWGVIQQPGMTISVTGGVLRIALASNLPASAFAGVRHSQPPTVVRDACATFELAAAPSEPGRIASAELGDAVDNDRIGFRVEAGELSLVASTADVIATFGRAAYDPTAHRFLRLQQFGTTFVGAAAPAAAGPFVELGRVENSGVAVDQSSVSIGANSDAPPAGAATAVEWSSFALVAR